MIRALIEAPKITSMKKAFAVHNIIGSLLVIQIAHEKMATTNANFTYTLLIWIKNFNLGAWQRLT